MSRLSFKDRFLTPPVARAMTSPVSILLAGAGASVAIATGLPLVAKELAASGEIVSVAKYHYAFMGSTDPVQMEGAVRTLAGHLKADGVDTVFLLPV